MNIKQNLFNMFRQLSVSYADKHMPPFGSSTKDTETRDEVWIKIKDSYQDGANDAIKYILNNFDVQQKNVEVEEPEPEENARQRIEYNNLCARATLYPGKTIEEVKQIQLMKRIDNAYKNINDLFQNNPLINNMQINNSDTRKHVADLLQRKINHNVIVKCDKENNTPEVIDMNVIIAELFWNVPYDAKTPQVQHSILVFGMKEEIDEYQRQYMLDNEIFKFIQKGI